MSDIYSSINEKGVLVADTQDILNDIRLQWQQIFGAQMSLEESTVQGRIIELLAAMRKDCVSSLALMSNQINPNVATGTFLEAIGKLFYIDRASAVSTFVWGNMSGTPSTQSNPIIIPAGAIATDANGNKYSLSENVTFDETGKGVGKFVNLESGAIPCPANTLTGVDSTFPDWESVNNPQDGTLGASQESDYILRRRIEKSKSKYSQGYFASIESALYEINGLKDCVIIENPTGNTQTKIINPDIPEGDSIAPHSVYIVVNGGSADGNFNTNVAEAILKKKSLGCGMQASTEYPNNVRNINVLDYSQDGTNFANYPITFNVPQGIPIFMSIEVKNITYSGADTETDVRQTIMDWFSNNISNENIEKVGIGYAISPFTLSTVLTSQIAGISVVDCKIGLTPSTLSASTIDIENNQIATTALNNIVVEIG